MQRLAGFIYAKDTTDRLRTRAILCHIYHHALHDNWFEARDLILMSHLQEVIQHSDPPTQVIIIVEVTRRLIVESSCITVVHLFI
jgi:translation initiation factor 3 subunit C